MTGFLAGGCNRDKSTFSNEDTSEAASELGIKKGIGNKSELLNFAANLVPGNSSPPFLWNSYIESGMPTAVDYPGSGNIIADSAGFSYNAVTFPKVNSFNRVVGYWPLITKRNSSGDVVWSKHLGKEFNFPYSAGSEAIINFALDGGLLVTMTFSDQGDQFPSSAFPANAAMLIKLNVDGLVEWARAFTIPQIKHQSAGGTPGQLVEYNRRNLTGMYVDKYTGVTILFGKDGYGTTTNTAKGYLTFVDPMGLVLGTRYIDLPQPVGYSDVAPIGIVGRPNGGIIVVGSYSNATTWTSGGALQTFAFRTGVYGAARGKSVLFGSANRVVGEDSPQTLSRASKVVSRANGNVLVYSSIYDTLLEFNINMIPIDHMKFNTAAIGNTVNMQGLVNSNNVYIYTRSAHLGSNRSTQWPAAQGFADGHAFILGPANQVMEEKYFSLTGSASSLQSGTAHANGYHLLSLSHNGSSGMGVSISVAGIAQTYFNESKKLNLPNGSTFAADFSRTCFPDIASKINLPVTSYVTFGLSNNVGQPVLSPLLQTTDATDIVWKTVKN
jgi:hypothetical protein